MCGRFNITDSPEVISMMESFGFDKDWDLAQPRKDMR